MTSHSAKLKIVMGMVVVMALFGFSGCAKKGQEPPGPDEVELVEIEEPVGEPIPST